MYPKSNTTIIWTPVLECCVFRCRSKNWHQKDMCLKEVGLHAQSMLIILGSIVNMIRGDLYDRLLSTRITTLITNKIFIWALQIWGKWLQAQFGFANHHGRIACFITYMKWCKEKSTHLRHVYLTLEGKFTGRSPLTYLLPKVIQRLRKLPNEMLVNIC